jgi:hypothetical protein
MAPCDRPSRSNRFGLGAGNAVAFPDSSGSPVSRTLATQTALKRHSRTVGEPGRYAITKLTTKAGRSKFRPMTINVEPKQNDWFKKRSRTVVDPNAVGSHPVAFRRIHLVACVKQIARIETRTVWPSMNAFCAQLPKCRHESRHSSLERPLHYGIFDPVD